VIGSDGTIYVQIVQSGGIFAFGADGTLRWQTPPGADSAGLTACSDGTLVTGLMDGTVAAVDPATGSNRWSMTADSAIASYAACAADGSIYVPTTTTKKLYALHPDGTLAWTLSLTDQPTSPPSVGSDGTVYVGTLDGRVTAATSAGTLEWSALTPAAVTAIAIGDGPTVYVASNDLVNTHVLSALDGAGQVRWSTSLPDGVQPPIVTPDGHVFANLFDGGLVVVSPTGDVIDTVQFGASPTSDGLAVSSAGLLFAGSGDGKLYAFGP
jgi:outer membrane protein assembly factor BamB